MDGRRGYTLHEHALEAVPATVYRISANILITRDKARKKDDEDIPLLRIPSARDARVPDCEIQDPQVRDLRDERSEAEQHARRSGLQEVDQVGLPESIIVVSTLITCPEPRSARRRTYHPLPIAESLAFSPLFIARDRPFWKDRQPQPTLWPLPPTRREVRQGVCEVLLVFGPGTGEEDEPVELPITSSEQDEQGGQEVNGTGRQGAELTCPIRRWVASSIVSLG